MQIISLKCIISILEFILKYFSGGVVMKPRYFAITGLENYFGSKILKPGMVVKLSKDLENEYDGEAISVSLSPIGKIGYVANSVRTVPRGCYSAGRIYDIFDNFAYGIIKFITKDVAIAEFFDEFDEDYDISIEIIEEIWEKDKNSPDF